MYYSANDLPHRQLRVAIAAILHRLPSEHVPILRSRFGIDSTQLTIAKTVEQLRVSKADIRYAKARAMTMLLHPAQQELIRSIVEGGTSVHSTNIEVEHGVEAIRKLTPELIEHLRRNADDLLAVRWEVFEHLVAELMASVGFHDVALIGRNASSAADIFAAWKVGPLGSSVRYFIEVKRWKDRVGVEVVDRVYGAMLAERASHGWHAALIVSVVGFKDFERYSIPTLRNMGIELKDKNDVMTWLADYEPDVNGLWLPKPRRGIPAVSDATIPIWTPPPTPVTDRSEKSTKG